MCLGEVGEVVALRDGVADVRVGDRVRTASLLTLDAPVAPGTWVLVHSGFVLQTLTAEQARAADEIRTTTRPEALP